MVRLCRKKVEIVLVVEEIIFEIIFMLTMLLNRCRDRSRFRVADVQRLVRYRMVDKIPQQLEHLNELTQLSDVDCFNNLRMNHDTFNHFCYLLRHSGGLVDGRYVSVGALDDTLIDVTVPAIDKARYCTRKGTISVNVLAVCDLSMRFVYMLTGWEGSAADARVLRDAVCRNDGFNIPHGRLNTFYIV
ncbi:hypothetical protein ACS0TY_024298 [Phlomoides rotata]